MKLLTKEIVNNMPALYETEDLGNDAPIIVKFFTPWSNWTWYAKEASVRCNDGLYRPLKEMWAEVDKMQKVGGPIDEIDDVLFFGLVDGHYKELGYFTLNDLLSQKGPGGLRIERDMHFDGKTIKDVM